LRRLQTEEIAETERHAVEERREQSRADHTRLERELAHEQAETRRAELRQATLLFRRRRARTSRPWNYCTALGLVRRRLALGAP
jgi:hypothetical protein